MSDVLHVGFKYEDNGAVHVGAQKYDFFPFTCGYMKKEV